MLSSIFHAGTFDLQSVAMALAAALIFGLVIAWIFHRVDPAGGSFCMILTVLPLLVAAVIMIVNGNLGTSVAVLGAFGLIRFRSAPGTAREILFLFYAMAAGLAAGMGFLTLGAIITLAAGLLLLLLHAAGLDALLPRERELRITIAEDLRYDGLFDDLFTRYTTSARLQRVKTTNMGTMYELSYRVVLRDPAQAQSFLDDLRCRNGNLTVLLGLVQRERNTL